MGTCKPKQPIEAQGCFSNSLKSRKVIVVIYCSEIIEVNEEDQIIFYLCGLFSESEIEKQAKKKNAMYFMILPGHFTKFKLRISSPYDYYKNFLIETQQNSDMYKVKSMSPVDREQIIRQCFWENKNGVGKHEICKEPNSWRFQCDYFKVRGYFNAVERNYPEGQQCEGCGGTIRCKKNCPEWKKYGGYIEQ